MEAEQTVDEQIHELVQAEVTGQEPEEEREEEEAAAPTKEPENDEDREQTLSPDEEEEKPQIDYDQEIPMPDGREPVTLSALKDRVIELERTDEALIKRENDLMKRADELKSALHLAGGEIPQELKERMQTQQKAHLEREHTAMLDAIPEWRDPAVFKQAREGIVEVGASYGFSAEEISGVMDHRMIKFMHDHARLINAQTRAKDNLERLKSVPGKKSRKAPVSTKQSKLAKTVAEARDSRDESVKLAAIDQLLAS